MPDDGYDIQGCSNSFPLLSLLNYELKLHNFNFTSCSIHPSADTFQYLQIIYTSTVCLPLLISALISLSSYNCLFFLFLSFHNYSSIVTAECWQCSSVWSAIHALSNSSICSHFECLVCTVYYCFIGVLHFI